MSNRAMAQRYSSGGGSNYGGGSLDLLGIRERRANRMADADQSRQIALLKLIDDLDKNSAREQTGLDVMKSKGFTPEQWKVLEPLLTQSQKNELQAKLVTQDSAQPRGTLKDEFLNTFGAGYNASNMMPVADYMQKARFNLPSGSAEFSPVPDNLGMMFPFSNPQNRTSTELETVFDLATKSNKTVPKRTMTESSGVPVGPAKIDLNKRASKVGINTEPVEPSADESLRTMPDESIDLSSLNWGQGNAATTNTPLQINTMPSAQVNRGLIPRIASGVAGRASEIGSGFSQGSDELYNKLMNYFIYGK